MKRWTDRLNYDLQILGVNNPKGVASTGEKEAVWSSDRLLKLKKNKSLYQ